MLIRVARVALVGLVLSGCSQFKDGFPHTEEEQARIAQRLEQEPLIASVETETLSSAGGLSHVLKVTVHGTPDQSLEEARATVEQAREALADALADSPGKGRVWGIVLVQKLGDAEGRAEFRAGLDESIDDELPLLDAMYEEISRGASGFSGTWNIRQRHCKTFVAGPVDTAMPILYADKPDSCASIERRRETPSGKSYGIPLDQPLSAATITALDELNKEPIQWLSLEADGSLRIQPTTKTHHQGFDAEAARILAEAAKIEGFDRIFIGGVGAFDTSSGITPENPDDERAARIAEAANG